MRKRRGNRLQVCPLPRERRASAERLLESREMNRKYDVIIIGAGHNGLVCAAYLARAGLSVLVLEANEQVGGAAITREFAPGYSVSAGAHLLYMLAPSVVSDLQLERHGLGLAATDLGTVALSVEGNHLSLNGNAVEGNGLSAADRAAYPGFMKKYLRFAGVLQKTFMTRPPRLAHAGPGELAILAKLGLNLRLLGRELMQDLLRTGAINIYDILQETFDDDLLKGALGLDALLGSNLGPRSPGSVLTFLYRLTGRLQGNGSGVSLPAGGMGTVSRALRNVAEAAGVEIRTATPVKLILLDRDRVTGIETAAGERIGSGLIASNADPRTTFLQLVGARNIETGFARRIGNIRMQGKAAKLHLALDGLPEFKGLTGAHTGQRLLIAPSLLHIERAFDDSKYGRFSVLPVMEVSIPSIHDGSLAPEGKHVLSAVVQYAPFKLRAGWDTGRDAFRELLVGQLEQYAPGIGKQVISAELLTPPDLEREFNIHGGHWHHGEYSLDQFMMLRPVPGAARYATPVSGLYLCGAGCHPGGGVLGLPGRNAANEILKQEKVK